MKYVCSICGYVYDEGKEGKTVCRPAGFVGVSPLRSGKIRICP